MKFIRNQVGWDLAFRSPKGIVGTYCFKLGRQLTQLARFSVGKKTGSLARSIHYNVKKTSYGFLVLVGSDNKIAMIHHEGTKPHLIKPKSAKTLRFNNGGKIVYVKVVHFPGTHPNRYLTNNLRKVIR